MVVLPPLVEVGCPRYAETFLTMLVYTTPHTPGVELQLAILTGLGNIKPEILVEQQIPQEVLVCDHASLAINKS